MEKDTPTFEMSESGQDSASGSDFAFAKIIVDIQVEGFFTYAIPKEYREKMFVGLAVRVPFGRGDRESVGYIAQLMPSADIEPSLIKPILGIADTKVPANEQLIALAVWMHHYYGCSLAKALSTVMPVKLKIHPHVEEHIILHPQVLPRAEEILSLLEKQRKTARARLLRHLLLMENHTCEKSSAQRELKLSAALLRQMQSDELILVEEHKKIKEPIKSPTVELNAEQIEAVRHFREDLQNDRMQSYLLQGITGSGKTEVYIEMIRAVLEQGRQAIVLVPEINLTYQTVRRLTATFGDRVAIVNSKLSQGERYEQYQRAIEHEADIMIGPRSAIFAPFERLGLIIMDEEHDGAYKSEQVPRYHTLDVARQRAKLAGAKLVLGSATPSISSFQKMLDGEYSLLKLTKRANPKAKLAGVHIVDLREELMRGNRSIFSDILTGMIRERLERREQVMLFMNRRGYSNFVSCRSCGEVIKCPHCDISLTLHNDQNLYCHYCGHRQPMPTLCPFCSSSYVAGFGVGTQKLEILTREKFPEARVLRLDLDTTVRKHSAREILMRFANHEADILIGTQMIVKGHDFSKVSLVGIMAADTSLHTGDYQSGERTFQLLTQAAGRAGRAGLSSDVVIQTYNPDHYAIAAAAKQNYDAFFSRERAFREIAKYPPYVHIMAVQLSSKSEEKLLEAAEIYTQMVREENFELTVIGPVNASVYKIADYYRKLSYIKHNSYDILLDVKKAVEDRLLKRKEKNDKSFDAVGILYDLT